MKDTYWFPHDCNGKDDPKCVLLIDQLGLEGYGIYWVLVETLREQPGYKYPINLLPALARRYNTTSEKVSTVVRSYGLFIIENDEVFFSESLIRRMLPYEEKREKARKSVMKRWEKHERNTNVLLTNNDGNTIREDKSIVDNTILPKGNCETEVSLRHTEKINYQKIVTFYNSICLSLPKVEKLTDPRKQKIRACFNELKKLYPDRLPEDVLEDIFRKAEASDFLKGSTGWRASFDWIFKKSDKYINILEGNYDNIQQNTQTEKSGTYKYDYFK